MELKGPGARFVYYFYYILCTLTNRQSLLSQVVKELGPCVNSITFQSVYLTRQIYEAMQSWSQSIMEQHIDWARSMCYFYYFLDSLHKPDESMELVSHGASSECQFYHTLSSLPSQTNLWSQVRVLLRLHSRQSAQADESMELDSRVTRSMFYFYYNLDSLTSRTNLWSSAVKELCGHTARYMGYFYNILGSLASQVNL